MARTESSSPLTESVRKRGRVACVPCRQAKVRCDLRDIPCSRCVKLEIDCSVNPGFRRTNKRDKVNELENNVQSLRSIVERQSTDHNHVSAHQSPANDHVREIASDRSHDHSTLPGTSMHHSNLEGTSIVLQRETPLVNPTERRSLGSVSIALAEVERLFATYFERYHPMLPILDSSKTSTEYYEASTPLFWTIISVALRSYKQDSDLLTNLTPVLCTHLWTDVGSANKNQVGKSASDVTEIQSMLLLATWPLPNIRLWSDRSLIMSNMALTSAMHIGLHRPSFEFEYARHPTDLNDKAVRERSAVWVACYCLCISLSLEYGHTPLVPATDRLITDVCTRTHIVHMPPELRHYAIIQRQANDAFQSLSQLDENPAAIAQSSSFFSYMTLFEKTFSEIEAYHAKEMSLLNKARLQGALLLLQSMYFLADPLLVETKQGILRAFDTATDLLSLLISEDSTNELLSTAPHIMLRIIMRAAFAILRVTFSSHGAERNHIDGKMLYNTSTLLLRQMSIRSKEKDQPLRVAEALKTTWKYMEQDPSLKSHPPKIRIRSRLGASIQYDCLICYRDAREAATEGAKQPSTSQTSGAVLTPASMDLTVGGARGDPFNLPTADWTTPSFEDFMESDLSWMDSLVYPGLFSGV